MILKKIGHQGLIRPHPGAICMYIIIIFKHQIFSSETAWPIKAKFYLKHLWEGGTNVYINNPGHMTKMAAMPIYGKNPSKIFFSETNRLISRKLAIKHRWLKYYCKFGNFRVTFISRFFDFRIISETLDSRTRTHAVYKAYCYSLLARTLFSRVNEFANISEN